MSVAEQDKQGVVDAHGQPQHHRQHRGDVVQCHQRGGQGDGQGADGHAHHGHDQRHARRHQGAECEDQNDGGHRQANDFGGFFHPDGITIAGPAGFYLQAFGPAQVHGVRNDFALLRGHIGGDRHIHGEGSEADAPVGADQAEVFGVFLGVFFRQAFARGSFDNEFLQLWVFCHRIAEPLARYQTIKVVLNMFDDLVDGGGVFGAVQPLPGRGFKRDSHPGLSNRVFLLGKVFLQ